MLSNWYNFAWTWYWLVGAFQVPEICSIRFLKIQDSNVRVEIIDLLVWARFLSPDSGDRLGTGGILIIFFISVLVERCSVVSENNPKQICKAYKNVDLGFWYVSGLLMLRDSHHQRGSSITQSKSGNHPSSDMRREAHLVWSLMLISSARDRNCFSKTRVGRAPTNVKHFFFDFDNW